MEIFFVVEFNHVDNRIVGIIGQVNVGDFRRRGIIFLVKRGKFTTSMQKYQSHFKNQIAEHLGDVTVQNLTHALIHNVPLWQFEVEVF